MIWIILLGLILNSVEVTDTIVEPIEPINSFAGKDYRAHPKLVIEESYRLGKEHLITKKITFLNGMGWYIKNQYRKNYPNEMGLCVEAKITEDTIEIYNYRKVVVYHQDTESVGFRCLNRTENTITVHSHPDIVRIYDFCLPSDLDVSGGSSIGLIVCGNGENVVDMIAYETEVD